MSNSRLATYSQNDVEGCELVETARWGNLESLSRLLRANRPIDFGTGDGKSVLAWACEAGRLDVMKLFFEHGAPIKMVL